MKNVREFLLQYSFFQKRFDFQIHEIQNYGRSSKVKVTFHDETYLVLIKKSRIIKYISRLNILEDDYRKLIEFRYLSQDGNVLVLNYYGGIGGHDLTYFQSNDFVDSPKRCAQRLYECICRLHATSCNYIDFDSKGANWYEYVRNLLIESLDHALAFQAITKNQKQMVLDVIDQNQEYFLNVSTCYIHGDLTIVNVCYHPNKDLFYLIDYDDFIIGDPFYDFSRLMNFSENSEILKEFKNLYFPNIEKNIIHLIYTLRVTLNWYCFILRKQLDYELPVLEISNLLNQLNLMNEKNKLS